MIVYRLAKSKYARDLSGKGAGKAGGRWNSKGIDMIYTSESRSLCTVEIAVHTPLGLLPQDYVLITLEIPDDIPVKLISESLLPYQWIAFPHTRLTQEQGDNFILENKFLLLKVPSAVVKGDHNILINPHHADLSLVNIIKVEPFVFDTRLFR